MAATTTTRRPQPWHAGPTSKASSLMASTTTTSTSPHTSISTKTKTSATKTSAAKTKGNGIRPNDPRLELSLRAFHQILPKKRPRKEAFAHDNIFTLLAAAAASTPIPIPQTEQTAPTIQTDGASVSTELGPPTAAVSNSCLYDPVSPWGVRGIAYDPALPQWALPEGVAASGCLSYVYEFKAGKPAVPAPALSPGTPWQQQQNQTSSRPEQWQPRKGRFFGPGLQEILNMIPSSPALPPSRPAPVPALVSAPSPAAKQPVYLTDKRFVLADVAPNVGSQTPQQTPTPATSTSSSDTPTTPASASALTASTTNGKRRRKPSMKAQLSLNGRVKIHGKPAPTPVTPHATPIPPPVTPIPAPVNGRVPTTNGHTNGHPNGHASRCCPTEVPSILHMILDQTSDSLKPQMVDSYLNYVPQLCRDHKSKFERIKESMQNGYSSGPKSAAATLIPAPTPVVSPLPTSLPPSRPSALPQSAPPKKKRKSSNHVPVHTPTTPSTPVAPTTPQQRPHPPYTPDPTGIRPAIKAARDDQYRRNMLAEIQQRATTAKEGIDVESTHGYVTNSVIQSLLMVARQPNADPSKGPLDVHVLTGNEARAMLDNGSPAEPVITEKEQMFQWRPQMRPIAELFRRMENLDRRVSVQVPSRHCMDDSFESRDLTQVRDRFLGSAGGSSGANRNNASASEDTKPVIPEDDDPWNILDLRSPLPAAVLPQFLTNENCQLLPRLRDEVLNPSRAERDTAAREQWNEWRDVLEWVLLSQGGHNTSPHTDSHGLGTWITVQEGLFGFGWLSHPTTDERKAWMADPHGFRGGRWCYLVLEPGQTVFFNSGTVHFVFRLRTQPTLALGGHILQWSGIERWLQVVAAQMQNPHITNEDMEWSAPKYVRVVARLVAARRQSGRVEEMGGAAAVDRLLGLLRDFDDMYLKTPKVKGRPPKAKGKTKATPKSTPKSTPKTTPRSIMGGKRKEKARVSQR